MKEFLSRADIPFTERNISLDPKAREEVKALAIRSTPATVIDGKPILGFSPNEVFHALGMDRHIEPSQSPEGLLKLLPRVIEATSVAVRRTPEKFTQVPTLDGSRPMIRLASHIFETVDAVMTRISTLKMPPPNRREWKSFEEIADYGDQVLARWKAWAPTLNVKALRDIPPEGSVEWHYSSARSGYEFLDYVGNHTTHHMRQFLFAMEDLGVSTAGKIPDSELPPEYIQTIVIDRQKPVAERVRESEQQSQPPRAAQGGAG